MVLTCYVIFSCLRSKYKIHELDRVMDFKGRDQTPTDLLTTDGQNWNETNFLFQVIFIASFHFAKVVQNPVKKAAKKT